MDKFKKLCKKPLLIMSSIMIGVFFLALLVMICIPNGKTYVYDYQKNNVHYTYKIVLGDKFVATHTYLDDNNNVLNVDNLKINEYDYQVNNNELFLVDKITGDEVKIGKINSNKLILDYNIEENKEVTVLYCTINRVLTYLFMAGLYFGILILAICITVNYMNKKQELLKEKAENIAEVQREKQEAEMAVKKEA